MKKFLQILTILFFISSITVYADDVTTIQADVYYISADQSFQLSQADNYTTSITYPTDSFSLYVPITRSELVSGATSVFSFSFSLSNTGSSSDTPSSSNLRVYQWGRDRTNLGTYSSVLAINTNDTWVYSTDKYYISIDPHYFYNTDGELQLYNVNVVYMVHSTADFDDFTFDFYVPGINRWGISGGTVNSFTVQAPLEDTVNAISSLKDVNVQGFNSVASSVNTLSSITQSNYAGTSQLMNDIKQQVNTLDSNMQSHVYNAIDEWHNEQESYVNNELDGKVQDIVDKIDDLYDYQQIEDAFSQVISIVTGGASRSPNGSTVLPIPAGTVTINGETLTFWEATEIDFAPYFDIPIIKTLLIPFRFVLSYGFLKYIIYWIRKLVDTITLHVHRPTVSGE